MRALAPVMPSHAMTPKGLSLATLSADDLTALVSLTSHGATAEPGATFLQSPLPVEARRDFAFVLRHVRPFAITLNESTLRIRLNEA